MDHRNQFLHDTLFIIVIYKCLIRESAAFQSLRTKPLSNNEAPDIFIYDNSPFKQESPISERFYFHNPDNKGVSAAYNEGFKKAKELGKKWLVLLDQDTELMEGSLERYSQSILINPHVQVLVPQLIDNRKIISPFHTILGKGINYRRIQPGLYNLNRLYFANSGLCITATLFEQSGGYDERFPLDFSDMIFIERLRANTSYIFLMNIWLTHSLSSVRDSETKSIEVLNRFKQFCSAAKRFKKLSKAKVSLPFILLPRSIKLLVLKKDLRFVVTALTSIFHPE